ncbi:hypothetical protein HDU67_008387 [Dinochytrium kinnereticum]|nr:hypothetical protein HDU67_008387 [Dinochytrium kinnereticum]
MATPLQKTNLAHQDVMAFLQDLDSLNLQTPEKPSSPAPSANNNTTDSATAAPSKAKHDVLSFLDELTSTSPSQKPPAQSLIPNKQPSKPDVEKLPSASHLFGGSESNQATDIDMREEASRPAPTVDRPVKVDEAPPAHTDSWSWGSIWSQAQATASKVSAATATSLTMAQNIVEDAAKVVTSEKVKGMVANVSKDVADSVAGVVNNGTVQKVGSDLSRFTLSSVSTITDILAPPMSPSPARAYDGRGSLAGLFATGITVWLCAQPFDPAGIADGYPTFDQVHDFVQATGNALWITDKPGMGICSKLVVNGVANPDPKSAKGLKEAIEIVEATLQKLNKFADNKSPEPIPTEKVEPKDEKRVFVVVQPFVTLLASQMFGAAPHIQFFVLLVCPLSSSSSPDVEVVSVVSQSVRADPEAGADDASQGPLLRWAKDQTSRVIETAITDAFEEFAVRCQLREVNSAHAESQ